MSAAPAGFVPCEFGGRVATCYHTPRCGWQVPGDWLSPFGRWAGSAAGPCGHSRGAINWDTGAWHYPTVQNKNICDNMCGYTCSGSNLN